MMLDLQWFAAEDEGRTQDPTEVTYRKAREEGRVAKSQELISALVLLLPAVTIFFLAPLMLRTCVEMLRFFFTRINELDPVNDRMVAGIFFNYFIRLVLPILAMAVVAALFANLVQTGFLFTTKPLTPDFSRVLPHFGRYFQRTLFSVEGLVNFLKSIAKMAIIGLSAYFLIRFDIHKLANLQTVDLWMGITTVAVLAAKLLIISALLLLAISIPDVMFQRWQFKESLKMTREQAREELKQDEGDPQIRSRLRNKYRELLSRNMLDKVKDAAVVITNPTHYSVALEYDRSKMNAPTVVAKGEDGLALRIREAARLADVPVIPHPPLTRALYNETELGDEIPVRYWEVVITLLKHVLNADRKQRSQSEGMRA
ncbi:MAG: flagellar biosynthesis protein FlhB [Treponema sp.]|jgi:flagellar biosynthetic protein FlhB|nr:flagellar biosynthesis protein FlhB [Treponema sp.]